jgi:hypothetical protein
LATSHSATLPAATNTAKRSTVFYDTILAAEAKYKKHKSTARYVNFQNHLHYSIKLLFISQILNNLKSFS